MRWRLAFVAASLDAACEKLERFDAGLPNEDIYLNHEAINTQITSGTPAEFAEDTLGELWVKGIPINWETIIWKGRGRRISLPTYPFDKQRFWNVAHGQTGARPHDDETNIYAAHSVPLDAEVLRPIFEDHRVANVAMLPASYYIQIVAAAVSERILIPADHVVQLRHLAWLEPIRQADSHLNNLAIAFSRQSIREYFVKIATTRVDAPSTHFVCTAQLVAASNPKGLLADSWPDLVVRLSNLEIYRLLKEHGLDCGPLLRGVRDIRVSRDGLFAEAVVESSSVDSRVGNAVDSYRPMIMLDAALQVSHLMAIISESGTATTRVPFALDAVSLYREIPSRAIVRVRRETLNGAIGEKVYLDLLDAATGVLCVVMSGLSGRAINACAAQCKALTFEATLSPITQETSNLAPSAERHVIAFIQDPRLSAHPLALDGRIADRLYKLAHDEMAHEHQYERVTTLLLETMGALAEDGGAQNVLFQLGLCGTYGEQFTGLGGLLGCIAQEYPMIDFQVVVIDESVLTPSLLEQISMCRRFLPQRRVEIRLGRPHIRSFALAKEQGKLDAGWKRNGVYIITGGLGGLGRIVARDIAENAEASHIVLVGRSAATRDISHFLKSLERTQGSVNYFQADLSNRDSLRPVVEHIGEHYGRVDGVIHCAGVLKPMFARHVSKNDVSMVFAPKVAGTMNLKAAVSHLHPDIFVLFSSAVTEVHVAGMSVYAAANGFMDGMANVWNREESYKETKRTRFISVAWPIWRDGGMTLQRPHEYLSLRELHLAEMPTHEGLRCLYEAIASQRANSIILCAETLTIAQRLLNTYQADTATPIDLPEDRRRRAAQLTRSEVVSIVRHLLAKALLITEEEIHASTPLSEVGITSIIALQVIGQLEKQFGLLPKTLLFEYSTIEAVTDYLMTRQESRQAVAQPDTTTDSNKVLEKMMDRMTLSTERRGTSDVAIIGVAGRYPEAEDIYEFWDNIIRGKDCIIEVPRDRWDHRGYFDPEKGTPGKTYSKWGGFLKDVAGFDAEFFNISPREAALMDPQERLFLMTAYHALEDAGYSAGSLSSDGTNNIGVFAAVMYEEYQLLGMQDSGGEKTSVLGSSAASIANRVSYYFDFHGPSMTIDTMCSSSLTAIHLACQSLISGECAAALAGGVNLNLHPNKYLGLAQGRFASTDGRCKAFAENADGYVPSEAVGVVLLKSLAQAQLDHDRIYGVIKATGINHGGRTNGYTVPSAAAQAQLISNVLGRAGVNAKEISYIEAHGTGTQLGDPLEITGLAHAFRQFTPELQFCSIGSVKTNIGHCESAAGVAGLTKVLMQMEHRQLAPSLYSSEPNAYIAFEQTPFRLQMQAGAWDVPTLSGKVGSRIAAVSSFGAGGSNAHLVVREPRADEKRGFSLPGEYVIIPLSAREPETLQRVAKRLLDHVSEADSINLQDIAYTLQLGRAEMKNRVAWVVQSVQELKQALAVYVEQEQVGRDRREHAANNPARYEILMKLSAQWTGGGRIDWDTLYERSNRPFRTRLPLYPFKRVRHWFPDVLTRATTNYLGEEKPADSPPIISPSTIADPTAPHPYRLNVATADVPRILQETLARALYYEETQMDLNATFAELGLDSVVAVEWIKEVNQRLHTTLSTAIIYEYTTLQLLAGHITAIPLLVLPEETTESILPDMRSRSSVQVDHVLENVGVEALFARVYSGDLSVSDALQKIRP
jgi:polyketide synthase PksL